MANYPVHSLRFGKTSETDVIGEKKDTFDSLVLNANSLAHFGKMLASLLIVRDVSKSFFIDPQTHVFQHPMEYLSGKGDNGQRKVRQSLEKLIGFYGEKPRKIRLEEGRPLQIDDLKNDSFIADLSRKVIEFQKNHLRASVDKDFLPYLDDEEFRERFNSPRPIFYVAPYFFLGDDDAALWSQFNKNCLDAARAGLEKDEKLFSQVVLSQYYLKLDRAGKDLWENIMTIPDKADGILLWFDNTDETSTPEEVLRDMTLFVRTLREKFPNKPIINLYGGYFSQLLLKKGLTGVVHGPEYGDYRPVTPVGGGLPIAKFYLPVLKKRISVQNMVKFLKRESIDTPQKYFERVCACGECRKCIKSEDVITDFQSHYGETASTLIKGRRKPVARDFPTTETVRNCLSHFMEVKKNEFDFIAQSGADDLLAQMDGELKKLSSFRKEFFQECSHLERWLNVLREH